MMIKMMMMMMMQKLKPMLQLMLTLTMMLTCPTLPVVLLGPPWLLRPVQVGQL